MKERRLCVFISGVIVGAALGVGLGCLRLKSVEAVVREPEVPGESRLAYTPPPEPKFSAEFAAKYMPVLLSMIQPQIEKVTDDIYVAMGYAMGNVTMVITDEGLVIIDTTESEDSARRIMADFRKITEKPVRYIIYTHFHPDHNQGTRAFYSEGVEIIATREFLNWIHGANPGLGDQHFRRVLDILGGAAEPEYAFSMPFSSPYLSAGKAPEAMMPTITFDEQYSFSLGGKRFDLFHTRGETEDHLAVWMPEERALHVGDLYYHSFPNLAGIMLEARPVRGWMASLSRFIALGPEYLILGHTKPLKGQSHIQEHLENYLAAIQYVHDETLRYINNGKSVEEAVAGINLPDSLARLPYLQGLYGRVDWSVRDIYHAYAGWYDGWGAGLNPLPGKFRAREIVALAGGADKILSRAIALQKNGEYQLSAELCDVVIAANPQDKLAHTVMAYDMQYLAFSSDNLLCIGAYLSAYSMHMKAAKTGAGT
ncbi:MAG TPA: alkyl/aryl-sulfatase [bacterium]|nr:alkyl/aryl-sulfatase [bacterium]